MYGPPPMNKWRPQGKEQLELDIELTIMLARTNLPFSLLENPAFKRWIARSVPRYNLKHRTTYAGPKLDVVYNHLMDARDFILAKELPNVKRAALTFDHWTSRNNDPFICITLHYINDMFWLRKMTLGIMHDPERHSADNIANLLDEMIESIPPLMDLDVVAVVDQANNMKAAVNKSNYIFKMDSLSFQCADHKLNTTLLKASDAVPQVKAALTAARNVCSRIHMSFKTEQILQQQCLLLKSK